MKVKFIGCSDDQVRFGCSYDPRGVLSIDAVYEVEKEDIHSWHTKYHLKGVYSGQGFPSTAFEEIKSDNTASNTGNALSEADSACA